jgi:hypothetical protein
MLSVRQMVVPMLVALSLGGTAEGQSCDPYIFSIVRVQPALHLARRSVALRVVLDCNCCRGGGNISSSDRLRLQVAEGDATEFRTVPHTVRRGLVHWRPGRPGTYRLRFELPQREGTTPLQPSRTEPVVVRVLDRDLPEDAPVPVHLHVRAGGGRSMRIRAIWPHSPVLNADDHVRWTTGYNSLRPRVRPSTELSLAPGRYVVATTEDRPGTQGYACFDVTGPGDVSVRLGRATVRVEHVPDGANRYELISECGASWRAVELDGGGLGFRDVPAGRALLIGYHEVYGVRTRRVFVRELTVPVEAP